MKQIKMNNIDWKIEAINVGADMQVMEHRDDYGEYVIDNLATNKNYRVRLAHVKLGRNDNIIRRSTNGLFLEHLYLKEVLQLIRHWKVDLRVDQLPLVNVGI